MEFKWAVKQIRRGQDSKLHCTYSLSRRRFLKDYNGLDYLLQEIVLLLCQSIHC